MTYHNRTVWAFGGPTGPEKMCRKMAQTRFIACPFGQLDAISRRFSKKKNMAHAGRVKTALMAVNLKN